MKPKIIFAVTNDLSYDQRMIRICESLAQNGFKVTLVGRKKSSSIPIVEKSFLQHRFNLWFEKGKLFYLSYNIRLFFFLLTKRYDIIGSVDLDTLLPCFLIAKLKGKPCVFDAHEYFQEVPEVINRPPIKLLWEGLANRIIPRLKYAYTVSASLQKLFTKKYGIPFGLVRNLAKKTSDIPIFKTTNVNKKPIILYQGVLNKGRGLAEMIEAMPALEMAELWIAGEGDLSDKLKEKVDYLNLSKQVKFLGHLTPSQLKTVTSKATIGLNLIENKGLSYYYSLANKTFDYMQAEIPAIHVDFPEYRLILEEIKVGILIRDLKTETLISCITQLLNDKILYAELKENCKIGKAIFNWENEEIKLLEFYQKIEFEGNK